MTRITQASAERRFHQGLLYLFGVTEHGLQTAEPGAVLAVLTTMAYLAAYASPGCNLHGLKERMMLELEPLVDPSDGESFLPLDLDVAALVDGTAFEHDVLVTSTHSQADGYAGDQTLLAPAYVSTDEELAEMVGRFADAIRVVERVVKDALSSPTANGRHDE